MADGASLFQQSDFDFLHSLVITEDDVDLYRELEIDEVRQVVFFIGPNEAK